MIELSYGGRGFCIAAERRQLLLENPLFLLQKLCCPFLDSSYLLRHGLVELSSIYFA